MYYISENVGLAVSPSGSQVFSRAVVNSFAFLVVFKQGGHRSSTANLDLTFSRQGNAVNFAVTRKRLETRGKYFD